MLTKRQHQVVSYLKQQQHAISITDLARHCHVSNKTIQNELQVIDKLAKSLGLQLVKKPAIGVYLLDKDHPQWQTLLSHVVYVNKHIRHQHLLLCLLTHPKCVISDLADQCEVSRQTITRDLSEIYETFHFEVGDLRRSTHGCSLNLDERLLREKLKNHWLKGSFVDACQSYLDQHFEQERFDVKTWLLTLQTESNIEFETTSFMMLHVLATLYLIRSQLHPVHDVDVSHQVVRLFECSKMPLDNLSVTMLYDAIQGSRLIKGMLTHVQVNDDLAMELLEALLDALQLKFDKQEAASIGLLMHLRATITRIQTGQMIENPLREDVRVSFSLLYEVVSEVMVNFEKKHNLSFSDHEIAYVVMHLGVLLQSQVYVDALIKIAIVCQHGTATSKLLLSRIQTLLPNHQIQGPYSVTEYQTIATLDVFDYVISTIPLGLDNELVVNPILSNKDTELIEKTIWNCTYRKQCDMLLSNYSVNQQDVITMAQMIKPHHILFSSDTQSWKQAITRAAQPLLEEHIIETSYIDKMIWAVETLGPYMVILPQVAFVHAAYDDGVNRNGISCLRLNHPIRFGEQKAVDVKVIFVIASKVKEDMGLLKLVRILEEANNLNTLLTTSNKQHILAMKG